MGKKMSIELTDEPEKDWEYYAVLILNHAVIIIVAWTEATTIIPETTNLPRYLMWALIYLTIYLTIITLIKKVFPAMPLTTKWK